jgi:hypothetical protein
MKHRVLTIVWPAFLVAGVLEMMVFAVVDPADLRWFGGPAIGWSSNAIYTVTFMIFWGAISTAGALTALLALERDVVNTPGGEPQGARRGF